MLETNAHLTHDRCADALEAAAHGTEFIGHASVTEAEICADVYTVMEIAEEALMEDERRAEGAWLRYAEGGWDPMGVYAAESLLTPAGLPAWNDPQAA